MYAYVLCDQTISLSSPYNFGLVKQRCDEDFIEGSCSMYYLVLGSKYTFICI